MNPVPLIVILGPTASGKSDFAMQVAKKYNGEIICADSRTVFRSMDIGTAKPTKQDQMLIRHYGLDLVEPDESFNASDFKKEANRAIEEIWQKRKLPIIAGGTGLYIDSVIFDYYFGSQADPELRANLNRLSVEELQLICMNKKIELPKNILNKRHLVRAIELGGLIKQPQVLRSNTLVVGITTNKDDLKSKVRNRIQKMLSLGVMDEAKDLGKKYGWQIESMKSNIYPVLKGVIDGEKTINSAVEEAVQSDLRLAKRQTTWFRRNPHILWGSTTDLELAISGFVNTTLSE